MQMHAHIRNSISQSHAYSYSYAYSSCAKIARDICDVLALGLREAYMRETCAGLFARGIHIYIYIYMAASTLLAHIDFK